MEAPITWQWRTWRGRHDAPADACEDHTMPPSSGPLPRPARAPASAPVPPVPERIRAEQPAPRVVFEDGGGSAPWVRLVAIDWTDRDLVTYQVQVARGHSWWAPGDGILWGPASGEERDQMFFALAADKDARDRATDESGPQREPAP